MDNAQRNNRFHNLIHWKDFRLKIFLEGILIGLLSGTLVVLFRYFLDLLDYLRNRLYILLKTEGLLLILLWFGLLVIIGFFIGLILKKEPMVRGSGNPEVIGLLSGHLKFRWFSIIISKFLGGILAIGAGLSVGPEGPSIQMGAAVGQGFSKLLGRFKLEEKYLITSGACAGFAAAFNAPLAGVIFALEEVHKTFSPAILMSAVAASLTADAVTRWAFGVNPIFNFPSMPILPFSYYGYLIGLGLITGIFGVFFKKALLVTLNEYDKITYIPKSLVPVIPLIIGGILGFVLPQALGVGNEIINNLGQIHLSIIMLLILLLAKFLFTMISYGSGVPGGLFVPLLVIGALTGDIYGHLIVEFFHSNPIYVTNFVVLAMAAYFSAIVKAPITGSILITEITGSFQHLLALITVSMFAYIITDLLNSKPLFEELFHRSLTKYIGQDFNSHSQGKKAIIEVDVCFGSQLDGKNIKDVKWPAHCLIVSIRRGETEIIPHGDTVIMPKDIVYALVDEEKMAGAKSMLQLLSGECEL